MSHDALSFSRGLPFPSYDPYALCHALPDVLYIEPKTDMIQTMLNEEDWRYTTENNATSTYADTTATTVRG